MVDLGAIFGQCVADQIIAVTGQWTGMITQQANILPIEHQIHDLGDALPVGAVPEEHLVAHFVPGA